MFTEEHLPSVAAKQSLYEIGRRMLNEAGYNDIGMDHFALAGDSLLRAVPEGTLHRNFMGYTHQYTRLMIGLGVSSISDSWTAFSQNVKKVEEYLSLVNQNKFPIFKGHVLTNEDLMIRQHILNIMCKGETVWYSDILHSRALADTLPKIKYLERDGLVIASEYGLVVTPLGKRFLRNICMAFDLRLRRTEEKARFSMAG
jgi:oxygen-independent coproporphyrinogen-3 oxidase